MIKTSILTITALILPAMSFASSPDDWKEYRNRDLKSYSQLMATDACLEMKEAIEGKKYVASGHADQAVVVKNGEMLYEWSSGKYKRDTPHTMWSVSKTITATLVGAAIQQGKLSLEDRVSKYFSPSERRVKNPGEFEKNFSEIKVKHLLEMTSGLDWHEKYENGIRESSVLPLLYGEGSHDTLDFVLSTPMSSHKPGEYWSYSGADNLLALGILKKIYGPDFLRMPWTLLFDKIGIKSARVETDRSGNYFGAMYFYMSAVDMARLGQLFLQDGVWNNERILPEGWTKLAQKMTVQIADQVTTRQLVLDLGVYSQAGFWLNASPNGLAPSFDLPLDVYLAAGHYGQLIVILPTQNMIITRTGYYSDYWYQVERIVKKAVKCFREVNP